MLNWSEFIIVFISAAASQTVGFLLHYREQQEHTRLLQEILDELKLRG